MVKILGQGDILGSVDGIEGGLAHGFGKLSVGSVIGDFVRETNPSVARDRFDKIVRLEVRFVVLRLPVRGGDLDLRREVLRGDLSVHLVEGGLEGATRIEDVINDEKMSILGNVLDEVAKGLDVNFGGSFARGNVGICANGRMIYRQTSLSLKVLVHVHTDASTTAPEGNHESRTEGVQGGDDYLSQRPANRANLFRRLIREGSHVARLNRLFLLFSHLLLHHHAYRGSE